MKSQPAGADSGATVPGSFTGGCACGAIRYACSAPPIVMLSCHCRDCQRASGGGPSAAVVVPAAAFTLSQGEPRWWEIRGEAGFSARRGFCGRCGSPLFAETSRTRAFAVVKAASLDDPSWFRPQLDIWTSSAQPWEVLDPRTHKFPKDPPHGG